MTIGLLPPDFDELLKDAVQLFWRSRSSGSSAQGGQRGRALSGKNLDGFVSVVREIAMHCGLPTSSIYTKGRSSLTLPGFYRPSKIWDIVVVHEMRLLAVFELKSHVGSFGNNFNNRTEEAIGSASDLWAAFQSGCYHPRRHKLAVEGLRVLDDPRPPFLGYLMLL